MAQDDITPINHSALGGAASTTAGAAKGALKGGFKTWLGWIGVCALIGVAVFYLAPALAGAGALGFDTAAISSGLASVGNALWSVATSKLFLGLLVGGGVGVATGAIPAMVGGGIGAIKGGSKASREVDGDRAAAIQMQQEMQLASAMQPSGPQYNTQYQVTPEEYAMMSARMRGGENGVRSDHANELLANRAAADIASDQRTAG